MWDAGICSGSRDRAQCLSLNKSLNSIHHKVFEVYMESHVILDDRHSKRCRVRGYAKVVECTAQTKMASVDNATLQDHPWI